MGVRAAAGFGYALPEQLQCTDVTFGGPPTDSSRQEAPAAHASRSWPAEYMPELHDGNS